MTVLLLSSLVAAAVLVAGPPVFQHWSASSLSDGAKQLAGKMDPKKKSASEPLGNFGNHSFSLAYRESDGEAEVHEGWNDIFVAESGTATLVVGGEVVGARTTGPGEIRGTSITGGTKVTLSPGDIVHIPANTPHQMLLGPNGKFAYFVMKMSAK